MKRNNGDQTTALYLACEAFADCMEYHELKATYYHEVLMELSEQHAKLRTQLAKERKYRHAMRDQLDDLITEVNDWKCNAPKGAREALAEIIDTSLSSPN